MKWRKLGLVFCPDGQSDWMSSHAANPVADLVDQELVRVYFSSRDENSRSSIAYVEFDIRNPQRIIRVSQEPVLSPGTLGLFDDSGASMACIVREGNTRFLYYLGWNLGVTVPWRNSIGLALAKDGSKFEKISLAPIMDRNAVDPYSVSYPWVLKEELRWRMWYGSNLSWGPTGRDMSHQIKYAESEDGITWHRSGKIAIPFKSPDEYAMSKPCVLVEHGRYRMWYSYRGKTYRIGYAESEDGVNWTRIDHSAGIDVSDTGWDSEMIEYPHVFDYQGERYMLYNGNGYGRTGFGIAVLEQD